MSQPDNGRSGIARIERAFAACKESGRVALIPYLTGGYPGLEDFATLLEAASGYGDVIEVGVPFSDPMADGPVIQAASQSALEKGANLDNILDAVARVKPEKPVVIMAYYNTIYHYGLERFAARAREAGICGTIIPDLIPEEAGPWEQVAEEAELATVNLVAPTSTEERISGAVNHSSGFLYCVSLTGITGARSELPTELPSFLAKVKELCRSRKAGALAMAVGFGISSPEHIGSLKAHTDGVIVGSSLVRKIDPEGPLESSVSAVNSFLKELSDACLLKSN